MGLRAAEVPARQPKEPNVKPRALPALLSALLAGAALLATSPAGSPSQRAASLPDDTLFFAMQIADEEGTVLAEPKLLGMCGVPLQMTLAEPGRIEEPTMSLRLQPEARKDGSYEVAFELSVPGKVDRSRGTMTLRFGEEKSAFVPYPGGRLEVQLVAFAVPSPEFDLYLEHGIRKQVRTRQT